MIRALIPLVLIAALPAVAQEDTAPLRFDEERFRAVQGVFCEVPSEGELEAPGTVAGRIELFSVVPEFQWRTHVVPAVDGISFGIKTQAVRGLILDGVTITLTHPPFRESGATRQSYVTMIGGASESINAYTFDTEEERVTGTWTFTAEQNGDEIYSARFEVVPPAQAPEIAGACGSVPMS